MKSRRDFLEIGLRPFSGAPSHPDRPDPSVVTKLLDSDTGAFPYRGGKKALVGIHRRGGELTG